MIPALYILAGGKSTRFGSDKARALRGGRALVVGVAEALATVTVGPTVVAARDDEYRDLGLRTIGDLEPHRGPLGGLATALTDLAARGDWALLTACDLIDVDPDWVGSLTERATEARAVALRGGRGWEPLFGLYHVSLAAAIGERLTSEDRSLRGLLDAVGAVGVSAPGAFRQANRPSDLDDQ